MIFVTVKQTIFGFRNGSFECFPSVSSSCPHEAIGNNGKNMAPKVKSVECYAACTGRNITLSRSKMEMHIVLIVLSVAPTGFRNTRLDRKFTHQSIDGTVLSKLVVITSTNWYSWCHDGIGGDFLYLDTIIVWTINIITNAFMISVNFLCIGRK